MSTANKPLKRMPLDTPILKKIAEGDKLYSENKKSEAIAVYKEILEVIDKSYTFDLCELYRKIGDSYHALKDKDGAIEAYENYIKYSSSNESVFSMLGFLYYYYDNEKSIEYYHKALNVRPKASVISNLCLTLLKSDKYNQKELKETIEYHIDKFRPVVLQGDKPYEYSKPQDSQKKLRIGYLSSDFHCHAMMQFVLPLLEYHNQDNFNISLYSCSDKCDSTTERIKNTGVRFVECNKMTNKQLAQRIHDDEIDILVDLGGYTHCRSFALYYKPAPVIMQYLGFVNTMGMKEVDYIFADEFTIPKEMAKYYTEKPMYIKCGMQRFDFSNPNMKLQALDDLPYFKNGYITFGSFNCPSKINDYTINLWARLLDNVPNSKLLIYRTQLSDKIIEHIKSKFEQYGANPNRIIFNNTPQKGAQFTAYKMADIALDPTPFNGLTITMELISMGVPVITLVGESMQSRGCARVNKALGLDDLVAENEYEYISKAKKLAGDIRKLKYYRKNLRHIWNKSALRKDYAGFAKCVEDGYVQAWKDYCKSL